MKTTQFLNMMKPKKFRFIKKKKNSEAYSTKKRTAKGMKFRT